MKTSRLYVDFNELIEPNLVLLSQKDIKKDDFGNEVLLYEGKQVDIYMDDIDENDLPNRLIATGIVEKNISGFAPICKWNCRINKDGIKHENMNFEEQTNEVKMKYLEGLFEINPDKAMKSMIDLFANLKIGEHDIHDGIGLYMQHNFNDSIRDYITQKVDITTDLHIKRMYQNLLF